MMIMTTTNEICRMMTIIINISKFIEILSEVEKVENAV